MKAHSAFVSLLCPIIFAPLTVVGQTHSPGDILFQRTDGLSVGGDDFTGALPDNTDTALPFGVLDDPNASIITQINVDTEGGAPAHGIDLVGDNFDLAFTFQLYDSDGQFSFTENFDDRVQVTITPIVSATDLTATGGSMVHSDVAWNVRTFGDYNFASGGWFDAQVLMTEDGGGAQSAGGIGFGFSNAASTANEFDYALVGGGAVFDTDGNGESFGSLIISFDPNTDTDGDGIPDGVEVLYFPGDLTQLGTGDFDGDGVNDPDEIANETDPTDDDSDDDGLNDGDEFANNTDPNDPDTDGDGILDGEEVVAGSDGYITDPTNRDTDGDSVSDSYEIQVGTDPTDPNSKPDVVVIQPSFVPIDSNVGGVYGPDITNPGMNYQENHYGGGVILNANAQNNYDVHTSGNPVPLDSQDRLVQIADYGPGGNLGANLPFITGGDNFSVRVNGYIDFTQATQGTYTIHLGADDTNLFVMDTPDGVFSSQHNCCPTDHQASFELTVPGYYPFDNVFGEQGGGEWFDISISGPGLSRVALGDTANGSPPVYPASLPLTDDDADGMPDAWETIWDAIDTLDQLIADGDFDGDGVLDPDEFSNGIDPTNADTDGDGLNDGEEVAAGTNPKKADSDGDGLSDGDEVNIHDTNPLNNDTDGDGSPDAQEIADGGDPNNPNDAGFFESFSFNTDDGGFTQEATGNSPIPSTHDAVRGTWPMEGDDSGPATNTITSPAITMPETGGILILLNHRYSIEAEWDGTALQFSRNGGPFVTVPIGAFTQNGYTFTGLIGNHVLGGEDGFNGVSPGYAAGSFITSVANFGGAATGDTFQLRFLGAWDEGARGAGIPNWEIDSVSFKVSADTDGDGIPDDYEDATAGLDKNVDDAAGDLDGEGVSNLDEFLNGSDPNLADTDGDGSDDSAEGANGTDPLNADSDDDGLDDGEETILGTDPLVVDTDGDGFSDGTEVRLGTDPNNASSQPNLWEVDLVAYWPQDGDHQNQVVDDYHGTADGSTIPFDPGLFGDAAHLDGSHSIIIGGDENAFDFAGQSMTVSAWFTADVIDTNWQCLIAKGEGNGWRMHRRDGDNPPEMAWTGGNGDTPKNNVAITIGADPETWHHVAGVTDSATSEEILYLDGVEIARKTGATLQDRVNPMRIGENPDRLNRRWKGKIDDVAIWNRALEGGEIEFLYNAGLDGKSLDIVINGSEDRLKFQVRRDETGMLELSWDSVSGELYNLHSETDLSAVPEDGPGSWPIYGDHENIVATAPRNVLTIPYPADPGRFFAIEAFPAPPVSIFSDDFESGQGDWTFGSDGAAGTVWELGVPTNGPGVANSLVNCFGTNLTSDYAIDADVWLRSPAIDLTTAGGATLNYFQYRDIEEGFDFGIISVLDAADDSLIAEIPGIDSGAFAWEQVSKRLPAEALGKIIKIEFRMTSDEIEVFPGLFIDDFEITVP